MHDRARERGDRPRLLQRCTVGATAIVGFVGTRGLADGDQRGIGRYTGDTIGCAGRRHGRRGDQ